MKKKLLLTLTLVVCVLCCALGLICCGNGGDDGGDGKNEVTSIHCSYDQLYFGSNGYDYSPVRLTVETDTLETLLDADINWWSDNPEVATVDKTGLVTPVASGNTVIHAEYMKMEATCNVSVNTHKLGQVGLFFQKIRLLEL